ncbi:MAG: hypothetical protein AABZ60_18770, partial [Planctomycetota bacterium]
GKFVMHGISDGGKFVIEGLADGGKIVLDGGKFVLEGLADGGKLVWDGGKFVVEGISDSLKFVLEGLGKAGELVVDQATGAVGYIKDGVYYVGGKTAQGSVKIKDGVLMVGEKVIGTLINTGKFIGDSDYREKVGKPWLKGIIDSNKKILAYQMVQNKKTLHILYRYSLGRDLSEGEMDIAKKQLVNLVKIVPALAIFILPGGAILLPMLAKMLPWELIPDLKPPEEVHPDEEIKSEDEIEIPEDLKIMPETGMI